jgi:hypothetical protein
MGEGPLHQVSGKVPGGLADEGPARVLGDAEDGTDVAPTRLPRLRSSPWARPQLQLRFSRPRRTISSTTSLVIGGRPGPRRPASSPPVPASLSVPATSLGVTRKVGQAFRVAGVTVVASERELESAGPLLSTSCLAPPLPGAVGRLPGRLELPLPASSRAIASP